jgi:hypothetical protein
MNDTTYVEAARALAERVMKQTRSDTARINLAYRFATGRQPHVAEVRVLRNLLHKQLATYGQHKRAASELVAVGASKADAKLDTGTLAAWTTIASVILNLDETITRE